MRFELIDTVIEIDDTRVVAIKNVSAAEEYLQDHFPTFPVLPGVLMLEAMVQAARAWCRHNGVGEGPMVLCGVRAVKYGRFVRPGETLSVTVEMHKRQGDEIEFKGRGEVGTGDAATAISGRFSMRPPKVGPGAGGEYDQGTNAGVVRPASGSEEHA